MVPEHKLQRIIEIIVSIPRSQNKLSQNITQFSGSFSPSPYPFPVPETSLGVCSLPCPTNMVWELRKKMIKSVFKIFWIVIRQCIQKVHSDHWTNSTTALSLGAPRRVKSWCWWSMVPYRPNFYPCRLLSLASSVSSPMDKTYPRPPRDHRQSNRYHHKLQPWASRRTPSYPSRLPSLWCPRTHSIEKDRQHCYPLLAEKVSATTDKCPH